MMLGLPESTDLRKQIPKDQFMSRFGVKGKDKTRFDSQIHAIIIRSQISPTSVNLRAGKDVSSIYVIELQLNVHECDGRNIEFLDKMGHKAVYMLTYGSETRLAVFEETLFITEWDRTGSSRLELIGLDLDEVWANIVRLIGDLPPEVPLKEAVEEHIRVENINREIAALEKKFTKTKQNHEQRAIYAEIQKLEKERDTKPSAPAPSPAETEEKPTRVQGMPVSRRARTYSQPLGGFINPRSMTRIQFDDGIQLGPEEIDASIVGTAVDYLTRLMLGTPAEEAFEISIAGSIMARCFDEVFDLVTLYINGLDNESIVAACTVVMFDSYARAGRAPSTNPFDLEVDADTCENIRTMVRRGLAFFKEYGPVTEHGPRFPGGYTDTVPQGDGDFLTEDTIWDFKVSKNIPTAQHTLQLAMYYLMGKHSTNEHFETIEKIGIFNPRLNAAFVLDMSNVPENTIKTIEKDVIGYP